MSSGGRTGVWKHCQGYEEEEEEKISGTWDTRNNCNMWTLIIYIIREAGDGIPDLDAL